MLTSRDYDVITFLENYKIASTSTIQTMIFPSKRVCQRRLKELYDKSKIKRIRSDINSEYLYYIKMPKQMKHALLVSSFLGSFSNNHIIEQFAIEPDFGTFRPDAFFVYKVNNGYDAGFLEVEISNKGFDSNKYERFSHDMVYKQLGLPYMPNIYVVGKNNNLPESKYCKFVKYDL